jgi:hypothetical protein
MKRSVESVIAIRRHGLGRAQVDGGTSVPAFTSRDIRCTTRSTLAASLFIEQGFTPKKVQAVLGTTHRVSGLMGSTPARRSLP